MLSEPSFAFASPSSTCLTFTSGKKKSTAITIRNTSYRDGRWPKRKGARILTMVKTECFNANINKVGIAITALFVAQTLTAVTPSLAFESNTAAGPQVITLDSEKHKETVEDQKKRSRLNSHVSGEASREFSRSVRSAASGDLASAEEGYRRVIELAPSYAPAYSNLGNVLVAKGAYSEALAAYTSSLEFAPRANDSWLVHVNRGQVALAMGDARAALEDMNVAERLSPKEPAILANRGAVWEALGKWDNALSDYSAALRGSAVQPFWLRYGLVLHQRGSSFEALGILNRVSTKLANDDVFAAQAAIHFDRGEYALAESAWSAVERPRSYENSDFLRNNRNWPPKVVEALERFRSNAPRR